MSFRIFLALLILPIFQSIGAPPDAEEIAKRWQNVIFYDPDTLIDDDPMVTFKKFAAELERKSQIRIHMVFSEQAARNIISGKATFKKMMWLRLLEVPAPEVLRGICTLLEMRYVLTGSYVVIEMEDEK